MLLTKIKHGILHLLYPSLCEGCSKPLHEDEEILCISCTLELPRTEYHNLPENETATRFAGRIPFAHATSFAYFTNDGLLQHLLHGLKYKNKKDIGRYLGRQFAYDLQQTNWIPSIDMIIPVPLHPKKEFQRGYNQSLLIAEGLGSVLNIPVCADQLVRIKHTESQTQKTRTERLNNMDEAFALKNPQIFTGKHILLIDDVVTTGATIEACSLPFFALQDMHVSIASIAIAQ